MKFHENIICLEYSELVPELMPKSTFDSSKSRGNITVFGRGGNGREILIAFESLPAKYRSMVIERYGNPYEYLAKEPIAEQVKLNWDYSAETYFRKFSIGEGRVLPEDYVKKYTESASWLKTVNLFTTDKRALKRNLNITVAEFWDTVTTLIRTKNIALPTNSRSLKNKLRDFNAAGYDSLVETWRFGNENRKKVKDQIAEDLLITMIEHPHNHDDTIIALRYNEWAASTGRQTISPATVGYRRSQHKNYIMLKQKGMATNYAALSKQIQRERPSAPLLLINSDDNVLDMFFRVDGLKKANPYYRPSLYVVMDAYNDYILGYAIGETVTIELVKAAYRNAMNHVMELTGGAYCWNQIVTDHWAIDQKKEGVLATFLKDQAHFTPATVKVAQSKYIERAFGVVWHQNLKLYPNYSGYNITAKERISTESIEIAKKNFPSKDQAPEVVENFINRMRLTVNAKTGKVRQQEWIEAFEKSDKSKKHLLDTEKRLQLFGVQHTYQNKITTKGIQFNLNGSTFTYDVPDALYLDNLGKKVQITYDPYDHSQVLVSDGRGLRFVANELQKMPSALADFEEGDRERLNNLLGMKTEMMTKISNKVTDRLARLQRESIDAESILQAGVSVPKELNHAANKRISGGGRDQDHDNYDWKRNM